MVPRSLLRKINVPGTPGPEILRLYVSSSHSTSFPYHPNPSKCHHADTSNSTHPSGISLIFTPSAASTYLASIPSSVPNSFPPREATPPPYQIVPILGKDLGVIATRKIEKYESFMFDHAALVLDMGAEEALGKDVVGTLMSVGVERLRIPGAMRGLSKRHGQGKEGGGDEGVSRGEEEVEGIMKTNAFGTTVAGVSTHALFPAISVRLSLIQSFHPPFENQDNRKIHVVRTNKDSV
jgi:hypothetical protein